MNKSIKIPEESYKIVNLIAKKEMRSRKTILTQAIRNFAISKKIFKE